jgi:hypothetical protein
MAMLNAFFAKWASAWSLAVIAIAWLVGGQCFARGTFVFLLFAWSLAIFFSAVEYIMSLD